MLFQLPDVFKGIGYYAGLSLVLWFIAIGLMFVGFALFLLKTRHLDMKSQKMMYLAYGIFFLFFALTRILFILAVFQANACADCYDIYTVSGYITSIIGMMIWLYVLETYLINNTKHFFFFISIISFGITVITFFGMSDRYLALTLLYVLMPLLVGLILLLYINLIIKTTGEVRKKTIFVFIGLALMFISHLMDSELVIGNFPMIPLEVTPMIMIAGVLVFLISQLSDRLG